MFSIITYTIVSLSLSGVIVCVIVTARALTVLCYLCVLKCLFIIIIIIIIAPVPSCNSLWEATVTRYSNMTNQRPTSQLYCTDSKQYVSQ